MLAEKIAEHNECNLQFYTLGRFEIYLKNRGYYNLTGRSTKLWYLFKYLLLNKRKGIPPETILETLYPYEEYENPKNTLQNIVYRLRKVLNQEEFLGISAAILYITTDAIRCLLMMMFSLILTILRNIYIKPNHLEYKPRRSNRML